MNEQAYLTAVYWLGMEYHSGQWSKGYRLLCLAEMRAKREFQMDLGRTVEWLQSHRLYPRNISNFRNRVAFWLKVLRKYRWSL